jgi:hypothetical protein
MTAPATPDAIGRILQHDPGCFPKCFPGSSLMGGEAKNGLEAPF